MKREETFRDVFSLCRKNARHSQVEQHLAHSLSQKNPIKAVIEKKGKFIEFEEEKNRQRKSPLNLSPKLLTCVSIFSHVSLNKINYFPLRRRKSFL